MVLKPPTEIAKIWFSSLSRWSINSFRWKPFSSESRCALRPLEIVSVCCFTICLGIAVDDTIHFLSRYQEERRHPQSIDEAIERAFQGVGTGMVMTTAVLVAGFASVTFSETRDYRVFGSLGAIMLLTALICDLFMLPRLLKQFDRRSTESKTPNVLDLT